MIAPFGVVALRQLADRVGLPGLLAEAVHPHGGAHRVDRGGLFTDLAISLAVGGDCVDDFEVIRHVDHVLCPGQATTGSASLVRAEMKQFTQTKGRKVMRAVARARKKIWAHLADDEGCLPASVAVGGKDVALGVVVLVVDATVVKTVSDQKEGAKGTFKGGVGYHPLTVWCDTPRLHDFVIVAAGGAPRAHARVENRIKDAKATGLATMPSKHWASNLAWTYAVMIATLLTRWYQLIGLTGTTLQHAEPKKLRPRLFSAAAQVVRSARQVRLKLSASWPWTKDLLDADTRVRAFTPLIT